MRGVLEDEVESCYLERLEKVRQLPQVDRIFLCGYKATGPGG